jgi:hypothetical protein
MKNGVILLSILVGLYAACTKKEDSAAAQDPKTTIAPSSTESQPTAEKRPSAVGKTLASYLKDTEQISLWRNVLAKSGLEKGKPATISRPEKVRAILQAINLDQEIHGGVARCPADFRLAFRNAAGEDLGSIGICGGIPGKYADPHSLMVRFDSTRKGEFGGIRVSDGKALMSLINEHLAAGEPE